VQFVLGLPQVLFGLRTVALHVVVIGRPGSLHLVDRFLHVTVNRFQVVPVPHLSAKAAPATKDKPRAAIAIAFFMISPFTIF